MPYPPFDASKQPAGDKDDGTAGISELTKTQQRETERRWIGLDQCGAPVGIGGLFNFWGLIDGGFLKADGTPAPGIDYRFDECSQTVCMSGLGPFLCLILVLALRLQH